MEEQEPVPGRRHKDYVSSSCLAKDTLSTTSQTLLIAAMIRQYGKLPPIVGAISLGYSAFTTEQERGELISLLYIGSSKPELRMQTSFYLE